MKEYSAHIHIQNVYYNYLFSTKTFLTQSEYYIVKMLGSISVELDGGNGQCEQIVYASLFLDLFLNSSLAEL